MLRGRDLSGLPLGQGFAKAQGNHVHGTGKVATTDLVREKEEKDTEIMKN